MPVGAAQGPSQGGNQGLPGIAMKMGQDGQGWLPPGIAKKMGGQGQDGTPMMGGAGGAIAPEMMMGGGLGMDPNMLASTPGAGATAMTAPMIA